MEFLLVLASALAPAVILFFYIRKRDEKRPEPVGELLKAFGGGVVSAVLAIILALLLGELHFYYNTYDSILGAFRKSLFAAALPEEFAKFFIFWLVVRKNRYFDERVDGIVYASCVALGFAALENVMYLFGSDSWVTTGVVRAVLSVPGHFFFGVLMGYYYSLVKFKNPSVFNMCMVLVAPILAHTLFNTFLMSMQLSYLPCFLLFILFIAFFISLRKRALNSIKEQLQEDDNEFEVLNSSDEAMAGQDAYSSDASGEMLIDSPISDGEQPENSDELAEDFIMKKYFDDNSKG